MVHVLNDTTRHAGHADILREHLDGRTGVAAGHEDPIDTAAREAHCEKVERSARAGSQQTLRIPRISQSCEHGEGLGGT